MCDCVAVCLRGLRGVHTSTWRGLAQDPRSALSFATVDPRIHFTLVCGAKSCPPIKLYEASGLDTSLNDVTEAFLNDPSNFDITADGVTMSMILKWYSADFGRTTQDVLQWCVRFQNPTRRAQLEALLAASSKPAVSYFEYNWDANGTE